MTKSQENISKFRVNFMARFAIVQLLDNYHQL